MAQYLTQAASLFARTPTSNYAPSPQSATSPRPSVIGHWKVHSATKKSTTAGESQPTVEVSVWVFDKTTAKEGTVETAKKEVSRVR